MTQGSAFPYTLGTSGGQAVFKFASVITDHILSVTPRPGWTDVSSQLSNQA